MSCTHREYTRLHSINPAEGVLFAFFDECLFQAEALDIALGRGVEWGHGLHWQEFSWLRRARGDSLLSMRAACAVDVSSYDRYFIHGSFPAGVRVECTLTLDGGEQTVISEVTGTAEEMEFESPVTGARLSSATVRLISERERSVPERGWLFIAGFADSAERTAMYQPAFPEDWYGALVADDSEIDFNPRLGIWFGADEMDTIRERAHSPVYAAFMDKLRRDARNGMGSSIPECMLHAREARALQYKEMFYRPHTLPFWRGLSHPARTCAFVGLLDKDADMLRYAARCAMALATRPDWSWGLHRVFGAGWFGVPGLRAQVLHAAVDVLDWAGSAFTHKGRHKCWDTAMREGVGHLLNCMSSQEWLYHHNHGINGAVILCLAGLARVAESPRGRWLLETAEGMLAETLQGVFMEDGATHEGPGYWGGVVGQLGVLLPLARYHGMTPREYVLQRGLPKGILRTHEYLLTFLSNNQEKAAGAYIPFSDSGWIMDAVCRPEALPVVAALTDDPGMRVLHAQRLGNLAQTFEACSMGPQLFLVVSETSGGERPRSSEFHVLTKQGTLTSRRPSVHGDVRINLFGWQGNDDGGHAHEDKGSLVLEVDGDCLLIDPGVTIYDDPRTPLLSHASHHNLLVPLDADGEPVHQDKHCRGAVLCTGEQKDGALSATVDITPAWVGRCRVNRRTIDSPDSLQFGLTDSMAFDEPTAVALYFQSPYPLVADGDGWRVNGPTASLLIAPHWEVAAAGVDTETCDHTGDPVHRLCLRAKPGTEHALETDLHIQALEGHCQD